jgi:hypothetical protein
VIFVVVDGLFILVRDILTRFIVAAVFNRQVKATSLLQSSVVVAKLRPRRESSVGYTPWGKVVEKDV